MPFTLDDGLHDFDAVEFKNDVPRDRPQNHIAFCPVCAAQFRHTPLKSAGKLLQDLHSTEG
jgi:hypothetical protein